MSEAGLYFSGNQQASLPLVGLTDRTRRLGKRLYHLPGIECWVSFLNPAYVLKGEIERMVRVVRRVGGVYKVFFISNFPHSAPQMDTLTFISEVIKSTAWPLTVVIVAFSLRKPIIEIIPSLRKLKYKEFEMEFSKELENLKTKTKELTQTRTGQLQLPEENKPEIIKENNLLKLAQFSARAAILEAWIEVESVAAEIASSFWNEPPSDAFKKSPKLGEYLFQCKVLNQQQLETFNKLRQLRNKAAHAEDLELSSDDAESYVELAISLAKYIKTAG